MSRAYSDIAFTPAVRAMQERMGSRANYAPLDATADRRDALTEREAAFIEARDGFYQATVGETGWPYVQFRGGPAGFLKVLDRRTIGYADFRGNVQYISVGNLQGDDRVSIILMDYANQARLKLLGRVRLVNAADDPALIESLRRPGYAATIERAVLITVEGYDWNCPQHITPRFTEAEIAQATAPLRRQLKQAQDELIRLRANSSAASVAEALDDGELALEVSGVRQLTPRVRAYELRAADDKALPLVRAGAHLALPVRLADGSPVTRHYSIASNPQHADRWEVAVLREAGGRGGSTAAHEGWRLGTRLNATAPANHFALHDDARPALLLAGGIGITPLRAMAFELRAQQRRFALHLAARSREEAPYAQDLAAHFGASFTLHAAAEGRRLDIDALLASAAPDTVVYVCGPSRFIDAVRTAAAAQAIADERLHYERFAPHAARSADRPTTLRLARSDKVIEVAADRSLLDAVNAAGIAVPSSCRTGSCRTCAVKVLAGTPEHRDVTLSDDERRHEQLMCLCVSRASSPALTLDL
jgi:ferredoxin-NADP reductase/predicted pyridoxine 5'-phosphate oxidase superfamily flavin-nucleotide-binding protein